MYLSPRYKGLPIPLSDDQRIGLNFNFAEEFHRMMNVRRFLGIEALLEMPLLVNSSNKNFFNLETRFFIFYIFK